MATEPAAGASDGTGSAETSEEPSSSCALLALTVTTTPMPTISSGFRPVREAATSTVTPVPPTTASSSRARAPTGRVFSSSAPARPAEIAVTTPVAPSATAWAWASTQQAEMVAMNTPETVPVSEAVSRWRSRRSI